MMGIYKITSPSGKIYIGQSWNIKKRFRQYKKGKNKAQRKLYNSFLKYGIYNHKFEIIHELPKDVSQLVLDTYEQTYMDLYRNCGIELLNIREGGSRGKHSEETKLKMSIIRIGNTNGKGNLGIKFSFERKLNLSIVKKGKPSHRKGKKLLQRIIDKRVKKCLKPVDQYSKHNKFIKSWPSIKNAQDTLSIKNISWATSGKAKSAGGFIWKYFKK